MIELSSSPRPAAIVACSSCWTMAVTGRGRLVLGQRRDDVAHVLGEQVRLEARLEGALERAVAVHFEHAALGEAAEQRLANLRGVHARLARERQRFGDDGQRAADDHLVAQLAQLPGARLADVDDLLRVPHDVEDRLDGGERRGVAADHDRQRAVDGADVAAADRRVEHRRAKRSWRAPRGVAPRPGAMLLMSMTMVPGCSAVNTPLGPSSTSSTSGESGTIVMMRVAWRATSAGVIARAAPDGDQVVHRSLTSAVDDQFVPGFEEIFRHGPAHESQPDEANGF